jgi:transcriptional regulator with XRE-family HTH domain
MSRGFPIPIDKLDRARVLRGWSVCELAENCGISTATASRALAGRPVSVQTLRRMSLALSQHPPRVELRSLLNGEE